MTGHGFFEPASSAGRAYAAMKAFFVVILWRAASSARAASKPLRQARSPAAYALRSAQGRLRGQHDRVPRRAAQVHRGAPPSQSSRAARGVASAAPICSQTCGAGLTCRIPRARAACHRCHRLCHRGRRRHSCVPPGPGGYTAIHAGIPNVHPNKGAIDAAARRHRPSCVERGVRRGGALRCRFCRGVGAILLRVHRRTRRRRIRIVAASCAVLLPAM